MNYKTNNNEYNIPLYVFAEVYEKLSESLQTKPIVIGGRAVNFLCYNDTRPSNDIDVVINKNPTDAAAELSKNGFMLKRNGLKVVGASYLGKEGLSIIHNGENLHTIDFYYSRPINGIEINELIDNLIDIKVGKLSVLVPRPPIMLLLKYDAGRDKDKRDFKLLLDNFYAGSIDKFFQDERELLDSLMESHKNDGKKMNKLLAEYYYYKSENEEKLKSIRRN